MLKASFNIIRPRIEHPIVLNISRAAAKAGRISNSHFLLCHLRQSRNVAFSSIIALQLRSLSQAGNYCFSLDTTASSFALTIA